MRECHVRHAHRPVVHLWDIDLLRDESPRHVRVALARPLGELHSAGALDQATEVPDGGDVGVQDGRKEIGEPRVVARHGEDERLAGVRVDQTAGPRGEAFDLRGEALRIASGLEVELVEAVGDADYDGSIFPVIFARPSFLPRHARRMWGGKWSQMESCRRRPSLISDPWAVRSEDLFVPYRGDLARPV